MRRCSFAVAIHDVTCVRAADITKRVSQFSKRHDSAKYFARASPNARPCSKMRRFAINNTAAARPNPIPRTAGCVWHSRFLYHMQTQRPSFLLLLLLIFPRVASKLKFRVSAFCVCACGADLYLLAANVICINTKRVLSHWKIGNSLFWRARGGCPRPPYQIGRDSS